MAIHAAIIILTTLLMLIGLAGSVLPGLPGSPLILAGAFLYAWHTGFEAVTWTTLLGLLILTLLSQALDFIASVLGVKKFGGSRWGMVGAVLGGILGIFVGGILGLVIGPFLGAFSFEILHTRNVEPAFKSGLGSLLGFLLGTLGKLIIAIIMIGVFLAKVMG